MQNIPIWQQLERHYDAIKDIHMRDLFRDDAKRFEKFSVEAPEIFVDYSKNRVVHETMDGLCRLAEARQLGQRIEDMFAGKPINNTEQRAVLHTALRAKDRPEVQAVLEKMRVFSEKVRSGEWKGFTGKPITDVVNIGIGGSNLGPKMVAHALSFYGKKNLRAHFVSNIDSTQIVETLKHLNPETTLFCIASKTFSTLETLTNAHTAKDWLLEQLGDAQAVAKHFVAISTHAERVQAFGIDPENMFIFWDWVGGRYSVWSAIGLSVAIVIGMDHFEAFLAGAHAMDEHFKTADFKQNAPVLLGLLGIWYRNFFHTTAHAVLPYNQYLQYFTAYLQQLDMESNGKFVQKNGEHAACHTGPIVWGGIGTDGQHAYHQLLHQGTDMIPIDFILFCKSLNPVGQHHALLYANGLAQAQALLQGKTEDEAYAELIEKGITEKAAAHLAPHKVMPGNRPSSTLLLEKLTPRALGALIALYEHKVFVQGMIWNINSFDQWGVELGKQLANSITPMLLGEVDAEHLDSSTAGLIKKYLR